MKYDIGLVCVFNNNYGNNITNYALYRFLKQNNYSVLLIKQSINSPWTEKNGGFFHLFLDKPFEEEDIDANRYNKQMFYELNEHCNSFVLGSDQLWSWGFVIGTQYFTCLNWVKSSKNKIAFGTSFGIDRFEGSEEEIKLVGRYFSRFNKIFIREKEGKEFLKNRYGIKSKYVCDPIFLNKSNEYKLLGDKSKIKSEKGIVGAYILDQSVQKEKILFETCERVRGKKIVLIEDGMHVTPVPKECVLKPMKEAKVEDLIKLVETCEILVTDSFHGMCLAIIFRKNFIIISSTNSKRGYARINSLLSKLNLLNRLIDEEQGDRLLKILENNINYESVSIILDEWINEGSEALIESLSNKITQIDKTFDTELQIQIQEEVQQWNRRIDVIKNRLKEYYCHNQLKNNSEVIMWGCGGMLRKYGFAFKEALSVEFVSDSNPDYWNKIIYESFECIETRRITRDMVIIVMIESEKTYNQIVRQLNEKGCRNIVWFKYFMEDMG